MPANLVQPGEEVAWERAKRKVKEEYPDIEEGQDRFYKLVTTLFENMKALDTGAGLSKAFRYVLLLKAEPRVLERTHVQGLPISIEARRGTRRHGRKLPAHYGRIPYSRGADHDALDIFLGPDLDASDVYVIRKMAGPHYTTIDEEKCYVGFPSMEDAQACFQAYYRPREAMGPCLRLPVDVFRQLARRTLKHPGALHAV
jgi:hypothetical protein